MTFSEALSKYEKDHSVHDLNCARIACRTAGCGEEETAILMKLVTRLKELSGKPIVLGV